MAKLLMPSGSADFRSLATKPGGAKIGTAMLAPYGDGGDIALSAKVGNPKINDALMVPYGGTDMALSAKVANKQAGAAYMALSAKVCGKRGAPILAPYGDAADVGLGAKVGSNGGGGKVATAQTRRVIRLNAAS